MAGRSPAMIPSGPIAWAKRRETSGMTTNPDRELAATIRSEAADDSELRASLKNNGWHPELPAIRDEFGIVLVGNRRLKIALEENIEPVIKTITLGEGKAADAERIKLALISNLGSAPLSPKDRQRIAAHLYGERRWTMERIGKALSVSKKTISKDLAGIVTAGNNLKREPTDQNPSGAGRRQGSKADPIPRSKKAETREERIAVLADVGLNTKQIAAEVGLGERAVSQALEHVQIARAAADKAKAELPPITI